MIARPLFLLLVFSAATWLEAQQENFAESHNINTPTASTRADTIQGCLRRHHGMYIVYDRYGQKQQLSDDSKVERYVGHNVEITGTPSYKTIDMTMAGMPSSVIEVPVFEPEAVKVLSGNCER